MDNGIVESALRLAQRDLGRAANALNELQAADRADHVREHWSTFLEQHYRTLEKLDAATRNTKHAPWFGRVTHERKKDPMLKYVHEARNVDSHGVTEITQKRSAGLTFLHRPAPNQPAQAGRNLGGGMFMEDMRVNRVIIKDGEVIEASAETFDGRPIPAVITPSKIVLVSVKARGVTYPVPTVHLDKPLVDPSPLQIAGLAFEWLRLAVAVAEELAASDGGKA